MQLPNLYRSGPQPTQSPYHRPEGNLTDEGYATSWSRSTSGFLRLGGSELSTLPTFPRVLIASDFFVPHISVSL